MNTKLNVFDHLRDTEVNETAYIKKWLTGIKEGEHKILINYLRSNPDKQKEIKLKRIPCIVYNFTLNNERNSDNIVSPTGFMFFDIDVPFDTKSLNRDKIFALYKSCTGKGIHIIVQVDGLTINNYDESYEYIINDLGITDYIDRCAKGKVQVALASYDPDLFMNTCSIKYDLSKLIMTAPISSLVNKTNKKEMFRVNWGQQKFRFTNVRDFDFDNKDYLVDWGNLDFIQAYKGKNIGVGKRNVVLFEYTRNFLYINQHLTKEELLSIIKNVNDSWFVEPLVFTEVLSIVNSIFKIFEAGKLEPSIKKRSIIFNPQSEYTTEEKGELTLQLLAERKTQKSKEKINDILESWDFEAHGLISQRNIAKNFDINIKTVEKYYSEFKQHILELNMYHKLSNK
jgi:hypothetical protein